MSEQRREPIAAISLVALALALILAAAGHWRGGIDLLGITMVAAGVGRLVLPAWRVGPLVVRHRLIDVVTLVGTGVLLILLVYIVPTG